MSKMYIRRPMAFSRHQSAEKETQMVSAKFEEVRNKSGNVFKFKARISDKKELNITTLCGNAYVHISDIKNATKSGKFDKTAIKQVSLNTEEVRQLKFILLGVEPKIQHLLQLQGATDQQSPSQQQQQFSQAPQQRQLARVAPQQFPQVPQRQQFGQPSPQQQFAQVPQQQQFGQPSPQQQFGQFGQPSPQQQTHGASQQFAQVPQQQQFGQPSPQPQILPMQGAANQQDWPDQSNWVPQTEECWDQSNWGFEL